MLHLGNIFHNSYISSVDCGESYGSNRTRVFVKGIILWKPLYNRARQNLGRQVTMAPRYFDPVLVFLILAQMNEPKNCSSPVVNNVNTQVLCRLFPIYVLPRMVGRHIDYNAMVRREVCLLCRLQDADQTTHIFRSEFAECLNKRLCMTDL